MPGDQERSAAVPTSRFPSVRRTQLSPPSDGRSRKPQRMRRRSWPSVATAWMMLLTVAPGFNPLIRAVGLGRSSSRLGPIFNSLDVKCSRLEAISSHQPQSAMGKQGRLNGAGGGIRPAKQLSRSLAGAEHTVSMNSSRYCTCTGPVEAGGTGSMEPVRPPCPARLRGRSRPRRRGSGSVGCLGGGLTVT